MLQVLGRAFATDGFPLVAPENRGPVDTAAWSRHRWATARWRQPIGQKAEFTATARGFAENRGGGTAYTRSGAREKFLSAQLAGAPENFFTWQVLGYLQDQSSDARFSTVDARRGAETPARDRFAVPATAVGATWTGIWWHPNYSRRPATTAGGDLRFVRAEARENFDFTNGSFARQRVAGGKQTFAGFFFAHDRELTVPRRRATLGLAWQAPYALTRTARGRWTDRQYDDLENLRSLDEATLIDVGVARPLSRHVELFLTVENLANARVETARRVDGVVTIGAPRFAFGGLRGRW